MYQKDTKFLLVNYPLVAYKYPSVEYRYASKKIKQILKDDPSVAPKSFVSGRYFSPIKGFLARMGDLQQKISGPTPGFFIFLSFF